MRLKIQPIKEIGAAGVDQVGNGSREECVMDGTAE
jgi:hypothetical protein